MELGIWGRQSAQQDVSSKCSGSDLKEGKAIFGIMDGMFCSMQYRRGFWGVLSFKKKKKKKLYIYIYI